MISMNGRPTTVNLTGPVNRPRLIPTIRVVSTRRKRGNHIRGISAVSSVFKFVHYLERAAIVENRRTVLPSQSACPLQSFPFPFCSPMMAISLDPKKNARLRCPVRNDLDRTHTFALPNQPCSAPSGFNFQRFVILRFQHRPLVGLLVFVLA